MKKVLDVSFRIIAALILLQTLFFKFTASPESVMLFSRLGAEPYGRIGLGIVELVAAVLLLLRKTKLIGAVLSLLLMLGAVFSHLFVLGIEVNDDGGLLFGLALATLACSAAVLLLNREASARLLKIKNR